MMENTTTTPATTMITTTPQILTEVIGAVERTAMPDADPSREVDLPTVPPAPVGRSDAPAWRPAAELRGSLNALGLCVRVLETAATDAEAREYIRHITSATQRIERLIAKRYASNTT